MTTSAYHPSAAFDYEFGTLDNAGNELAVSYFNLLYVPLSMLLSGAKHHVGRVHSLRRRMQ